MVKNHIDQLISKDSSLQFINPTEVDGASIQHKLASGISKYTTYIKSRDNYHVA